MEKGDFAPRAGIEYVQQEHYQHDREVDSGIQMPTSTPCPPRSRLHRDDAFDSRHTRVGEVWGRMQAEGIWGAAEKSRKSEEPEVRRRMLKWFGHEVVWGGVEIKWFVAGALSVDKGDGAVEEGSIPVTHGDIIGTYRDSKIQAQLKSHLGSRLEGGWRRQLLCYIFRSKDVEPGQRLAYELTERQQMAIDDV